MQVFPANGSFLTKE